MAVNKVLYGGNTLIDLTADTVTAADVASGKTFHLPDGSQAVGSAPDNFRIWKYTVAATITDKETIAVSDWIKENCDKPNFGIAYMYCGTPPTPSANYYGVNGVVTNYTTTGNNTYGAVTRVSTSGAGTMQRVQGNAYSSNNGPMVYAKKSTGELRFIASSSNVFPAGDYIIVAWY